MKIGIIGTGFIGNMHANLYSNISDVQLTGVTSKTLTKAKELSNRLGIKCFNTFSEMLSDNTIEIIDVCSPTNMHMTHAIEAMQNGKHVIIEYPAVVNYKEVINLHKVSEKTGMHCMLAYSSRYQSHYKYVFDVVRSGELGDIRNLFISRKSSNVFASSDIINNLISQDIDFMVHLLGVPQSVSCMNIKQEYACLTFKYQNCVAVIEGTTNMHDNYAFSTHHSIAGSLKSIDLQWEFVDHPEYKMVKTSLAGQEDILIRDYDPYQNELEEILEDIKSNNTKNAGISTILDSSKLSFKCRNIMK